MRKVLGATNLQKTIEMKSLVKDVTTSKKPHRIGKPRRVLADVHAMGSITEEIS